jgi:hypothetical protein
MTRRTFTWPSDLRTRAVLILALWIMLITVAAIAWVAVSAILR